MDDDSDYSGDDVDVEDGIKLVKVPMIEINMVEYKDRSMENSLQVSEDLAKSKLE